MASRFMIETRCPTHLWSGEFEVEVHGDGFSIQARGFALDGVQREMGFVLTKNVCPDSL